MIQQIHITACSPRSGTTLLHEAMITCFKVNKHYNHEIRFHKSIANDGDVLVTKRPKDTYYMESILDKIPGFNVIYMVRDPRDVIVSKHGKQSSVYYSNITLWRHLHSYGKRLRSFDNFLEIRYEDFVNNPDQVQDAIAERFPWLEKVHNFSDYHLHANASQDSVQALKGIRPIAPSSVQLWKKNLARIKAQHILHGSLTPDLIECGYETSDEWEKSFEGVEPDFSKSHYPENISALKKLSLKLHGAYKLFLFKRSRKTSTSI